MGLAKVMSKMGISVLDSYCAAHLFDAIGISQTVVGKCFAGVPAPIGGFGFEEIEAYVRDLWLGKIDTEEPSDRDTAVVSATQVRELPDYGFIRFRKADDAESHLWQPQTVRALQTVVGSTKQGAALALSPFSNFAAQATEANPLNLRDLLEIRPAGQDLALDQVESAGNITKRFIASAMSFGSLRLVVGRFDPVFGDEGPQPLLMAQQFLAGSGRRTTAALLTGRQHPPDCFTHRFHGRLELRPRQRAFTKPMPQVKQGVALPQQPLPNGFARLASINHRLEVPPQMGPTPLQALDPPIRF